MQKIIFLILCFFSLNSFAETLTFRLFEDSVDEFTPFTLSMEFDGEFKKGSVLKSVVLKDGKTVLFSFDAKTSKKIFDLSWKANGSLGIIANHVEFKSVVKKEVSNGWGDTSINPTDKYTIWLDSELLINREGTLNGVRFEIANQTVEETCLWGILKK